MRQPKVVHHHQLRDEMMAVARGARPAPADAALPSVESVGAIIRLLTPENRRLLAIIRNHEPGSIAELATLTGRASSNLTRTLAKLEAAGLVRLTTIARRKAPRATVTRLLVEIDVFGQDDRLAFA